MPAGGTTLSGGMAAGGAAAAGSPTDAAGGSPLGGAAGAPAIDGPISGMVLHGGRPLAGVAVILNAGATTLTGKDGTFSFDDPGPSYRLVLVSSSGTFALVVDGMRKRQPRLQFSQTEPECEGNIQGQLSGSVQGSILEGFVAADGEVLTYGSTVYNEPSTYKLYADWRGPSAVGGKAVILSALIGKYYQQPIVPTQYLGYAEQPATVKCGGTATADVTMGPVTGQRELSGAISLPEGYHPSYPSLGIGPFEFDLHKLGANYACSVPTDPALSAGLRVTAYGDPPDLPFSSVTQTVPASGDLDFELPKAAIPILPATDTAGVTLATKFSWTAPAERVVTYARFQISPWTILEVTEASETTIPDLTAYGFALPKAADGSWGIEGRGPAASVDGAVELRDAVGNFVYSDAVYTRAEQRFFKTAP